MVGERPTLQLWRGDQKAVEIELDAPQAERDPLVVGETDRLAFELSPSELGQEYEIRIGDFPLPKPHHGRRSVEWGDDAYFDSARGRTPVAVVSRETDGPDGRWVTRGRFDVWVCPGKLTEAAYRRMFDDLASLSAGLVFDLLAKSAAGVGEFGVSRAGVVAARSAQMELRILERLWAEFSRVLMGIMLQPETSLVVRREMTACHGTERLAPQELVRIAARGVDPRRSETPRPFTAELAVMGQSVDTPEHRAIATFLDLISERARECLTRARHEIGEVNKDRWFRDRNGPGGQNLYEAVDAPRVARLEGAAVLAERLTLQIRMARRSFSVVTAAGSFRDAGASPVFRNVRQYRQAWRLMLGYLNSSAVAVDAAAEERTKQTWRMYEQWTFLQLAAAFRRAGLRCSSQRDFVNALSRNRFTVDLQRGTRLVFAAPDDRRVVMRYEPWVFSRKVAADLGETVYQGSEGEAPWSPDVLIEFMKPAGDGAFELEYALVVDAKYVRHLRDGHREQCLKYMRIRSVETGEAIVRQVWLASPAADGIALDDDGLAWTASGPTARRHEVVMGSLGLTPSEGLSGGEEDQGPPATALEFVNGILAYLGVDVGAATIKAA
jgi:hypothetical protein